MRRTFTSLVLATLVATGGVVTATPAAADVYCNASTTTSDTKTYAYRWSCTHVRARIDRYASTLQIFYGTKGLSSEVSSSVGVNAGNYYMKWQATSASSWLAA